MSTEVGVVSRIIKRLTPYGEKVNGLVWPFIFGTLFYGLGFVLFSHWSGVSGSSLHKAMAETDPLLPTAWGMCASAAAILALIFLYARIAIIGEFSTFFGFLVWVYAAWVYADRGVFLVALTVAGTNAYFWAWFYLKINECRRNSKANRLARLLDTTGR